MPPGPHVRVSIETGNSLDLVDKLDAGELDLALSTDHATSRKCETLFRDQLAWIGAPGTTAHLTRPLPLAIGGARCRFRPSSLQALMDAGIEWRVVIEVTNQEAMCAPVTADLAVAVLLADSVPDHLQIIGPDQGLPPLPPFDINLHLPHGGGNELSGALADVVRTEFAALYGNGGGRPEQARSVA